MRLPRQWKTKLETSLLRQVTSYKAFIAYGKWWVHCVFLFIAGSAAFHNLLALKPVMSSVQRMSTLSPHWLSVSQLRGICRGLKFWPTLCNGCSVATARIFIPWAIKTSPFRSGSVTCRSRAVYAEYLVLKFLKLKGCTMSSNSTSSPFHHSKMLILFSFFIKKKKLFIMFVVFET